MNKLPKHIGLFIGIMLFQILILNNVNVGGWITPYVYPLIILILPMEIAGWILLLVGFITGLTVDVFAGTLGMHAFSSVLLAALRPGVIDRISQRNQDLTKSPSLNIQGFTWMALYLTTLMAVHHLSYFIIEYWSFASLWVVLLKFLINTIVSVFIMFLILYAFRPAKKR